MKFLITTLALFSLFSCNQLDEIGMNDDINILNGSFEGTFIRSSPNAKYRPSNIILNFQKGAFDGESEIKKYPAIGIGTYQALGDSIEFNNSSLWTAEFDWTLILSGTFSYELDTNKLILQKRKGEIIDRYELNLK